MLDIEAIHGIAPEAHIVYVGVDNLGDTNEGINYVLEKKLATIISNSYYRQLLGPQGPVDPSNIKATDAILKQAAILGVGCYFSTGKGSFSDVLYMH